MEEGEGMQEEDDERSEAPPHKAPAPTSSSSSSSNPPLIYISSSSNSGQSLKRVIESNAQAVLRDVPLLTPPPSLRAELHPHQIWGISWMSYMYSHGLPMILGDQMGLG